MTLLRAAIGAEWIKLWTTRTVWWALVAALVLMAAGSGQYALYANNGDLDDQGTATAGTVAVMALGFAQLAFLALAMLVMTSEFSTGTIRATLSWIPSRGRLLLAKCAVVAAVTFVTGVVAGVAGAAVATSLMDSGGGLDLTTAAKIGLYLALLGVLAVGLGAAFRGPVVTLVVLLMLVVAVPPLLQVPDIAVLNGIADAMPGVAGDHFLRDGSVVGLLILTAWAVAAAVAGRMLLMKKDA
ncbi:ABC transporter permease [Actinoplanes sp. LDG1-06]|uniref:ABC transporter permease n=1 Tax=Paractinoplanes ovalisporus TaxID=2810368 RepID=A0ABS2ARG5_9ACTN|nr:ABC transporter permease [Actinoplanes ovalisporus]MBM2621754.1 ABC transporter permease [Actinoplanes ovalisporus]